MLNNHELLKLYNAEKAALEFPSEPFLPFKQWKKEYVHSMRGCFQTKQAKEAVDEADQIVADAEKELSAKTTKKTKKSTPKPIVKPVTEVSTKVNGVGKKSDIAEQIYRSMMVNGEHPKRADVVARFVSEVGLTQAGASTYQYNIKKKLSQQAA